MHLKNFLLQLLSLLVLVSCTEFSAGKTFVNAMTLSDSKPPVLLEVISESDKTIRLIFNENVQPFHDSFAFCNAVAQGNNIIISLPSSVLPGQSSSVEGRVRDSAGNTAQVNVTIWGYNRNPAKLIINEFTTKGSENNPDRTELFVLKEGSLAGLTIYAGTPSNYDAMFILPDVAVQKGDYITIRWTGSSGTPSQELIFSVNSSGLTSNNGTIVVTDSPSQGAEIIDAVIYSSMDSVQYDGWGTKTAYERARWVIENKGWSGNAVNSSNSTATRSMCRFPAETDTDTSADWFVTVTGGATFGSQNNSPAY